MDDIKEGPIHPGDYYWFPKTKFTSDSYVWRTGDAMFISFVETVNKGAGDLKRLFKEVEGMGFTVKVPTALPLMKAIIERWGFVKTIEVDKVMGPVEVWVRSVPSKK